jgi:hypothetical protein
MRQQIPGAGGDLLRGPTKSLGGSGVAIMLGYAVLALASNVMAVDVTNAMGVLAYTMDTACPLSDWADLSSDPIYNGRLIKGWNPSDNSAIGAQHLPNNPSTGNEIITHSHSFSRGFKIGLYPNPALEFGTANGAYAALGAVSVNGYVDGAATMNGYDDPASPSIQSTRACKESGP